MRSLKLVFVLGVAMWISASGARAGSIVLGFDDLIDLQAPVPDGYGGLNWENMWVVNGDTTVPSGFWNGLISPGNVAYANRGNPVEVLSTSPASVFTFDSAYVTAAWENGLGLRITGLADGVQEYQTSLSVDATGPTLVSLGWSGIDELRIEPSRGVSAGYPGNGTEFVVDNFTYELGAVGSVVPEPASAALYAVGGICLAFYIFGRRYVDWRGRRPDAAG